MMTKTDFYALADILKDNKPPSEAQTALETWTNIVYRISKYAKEVNPRFDPVRFKQACGVENGQVLW